MFNVNTKGLKMRKSALTVFIVGTMFTLSSQAQAVFKCKDSQGKLVYSDAMCEYGAGKADIRSNTIANPKAQRQKLANELEINNPATISVQAQQPGPSSDITKRLTDECARGFKQSCTSLRATGSNNADSIDSTQKDKLSNECSRGYKDSCRALRAATGVKGPTVCQTTGTLNSNYAGGANFRGNTLCAALP